MVQISVDALLRELEAGSGYGKEAYPNLNKRYESVRFEFCDDNVVIIRQHGYDCVDQRSSEVFHDEWRCILPRPTVDRALEELVSKGRVSFPNVLISESCRGRRNYESQSLEKVQSYKADLDLILRVGRKPILYVRNPWEIPDVSLIL